MNVSVALLLVLQDPELDVLLERLRADAVEERERAAWELTLRGDAAVPALRGLARDSDRELALRAREILETVDALRPLSPALLRAVPQARQRLASRRPSAWTELFLELAEPQGSRLPHPELTSDDLRPLAARAARGAEPRDASG